MFLEAHFVFLFENIQRKFKQELQLPKVEISAEYKKPEGEIYRLENLTKLRRPKKREKLVIEEAKISLENIIKFHERTQENMKKKRKFSVDGSKKIYPLVCLLK